MRESNLCSYTLQSEGMHGICPGMSPGHQQSISRFYVDLPLSTIQSLRERRWLDQPTGARGRLWPISASRTSLAARQWCEPRPPGACRVARRRRPAARPAVFALCFLAFITVIFSSYSQSDADAPSTMGAEQSGILSCSKEHDEETPGARRRVSVFLFVLTWHSRRLHEDKQLLWSALL